VKRETGIAMRQLIKRAVSITAISGAVLSISITASQAAPAGAGWRLVVQDHSVSAFQSVAAPARRDAWAVGYRPTGLLVRHWTGRHWQPVKVPGAAGFLPSSVQAPSPSDVWIFGTWNGHGYARVLHWNGRTWSSPPLPAGTSLVAALALSPANVWIAGGPLGPDNGKTMMWHWNGASWRSSILGTDISGLAAAGPSDVWAVGMTVGSHDVRHPAAYRWNGHTWRYVSMPRPRIGTSPTVAVSSASTTWVALPLRGAGCSILKHHGRTWTKLRIASWAFPLCGDLAADGHGGLWDGPFAHWTGRAWAQLPILLPFANDRAATITDMIAVPRSSAMLLTGYIQRTRNSSAFDGLIAADGRLP
jgi:hypothetical protein